jgi:type III pantothenate kinase
LNLVIDIGNTRAKTSIFNNNSIVDQRVYDDLKVSDIEELLQIFSDIDKCILSSVGAPFETLIDYLQNILPVFIELTGNTPIPFTNQYESKSTQGSDRIAAIAGAQIIFPASDVLVLDAGTTITFDLIDASGIYKGGNISPGIDIRFQALHTFTQKLPLLSKKEVGNNLGVTTNQAIESGVQNGVIYEIEGYLTSLKKEFKNLKTILTGGDAEFLANKFKNIIFVESNLVLIGLNRILEYNVSK